MVMLVSQLWPSKSQVERPDEQEYSVAASRDRKCDADDANHRSCAGGWKRGMPRLCLCDVPNEPEDQRKQSDQCDSSCLPDGLLVFHGERVMTPNY